ncbi:MAG: iron-only hydrogenase system regulator [Deltaproteobacteria bacterium]|jgi:putative iron-only hydrogenase system regulator|nr:iron-only hydrogenase system regulator [Deltaproteobacteria bacterium]
MSDSRVALLGIVVSDPDSVEGLNQILHQFSQYIIGRMGIPYGARKINLISVAVDAPLDVITAMGGKIGKLPGVSSKTAYSSVGATSDQDEPAD